MNDLSFVDHLPTRPDGDQERRERYREILLEGLRRKIKHLHNDAESAQIYARDYIRAGGDASEELKELEVFGNGLLLVVMLLQQQATKGE